MIIALYIAGALVAAGLVLWIADRRYRRRHPDEAPAQVPEQCCGMHITCERDSLLASVSDTVEYYDDEELDAFAGRGADEYTDDEAEQFREVLLTLRPDDIAPWARSVQLRGITLPAEVREELLMIVAEARASRHVSGD